MSMAKIFFQNEEEKFDLNPLEEQTDFLIEEDITQFWHKKEETEENKLVL